MRAYKFLDSEGRAPFTAADWPIGEWIEAGAVRPCHEGVHACRARDVAYWLSASMWHVELDGDVIETHHKVVATRGRLLGPVDGYADAMRELCELSSWRCRERAVLALRDADEAVLADQLSACASLAELAALAVRCDDSTFAGRAAALAADCATFAKADDHNHAPFVATYSAGHVAAGRSGSQTTFDAGYEDERRFQSDWLTRRLVL